MGCPANVISENVFILDGETVLNISNVKLFKCQNDILEYEKQKVLKKLSPAERKILEY